MISIRESTNADWAAIRNLALRGGASCAGSPAQGDWLQNRVTFARRRWAFVAERDGVIVGFGAPFDSEPG
jgi:hypothetical protein